MKQLNNKYILEAVKRGINLALDLFDYNDNIQTLTHGKVKVTNITKEYLDLMKEVVDLGLPSGTLWCKYNLGADPNKLTKPGDWYGNYYAWGELEGNKPEFSWSTYKYAEHYTDLSEKECLTKYCNNPQKGYNQITKRWGFTDNLTKLQPEDDAAYLNKKLYNFKFHIPTKEQCEELIKYTTNYWVYNYEPNKIIHNPKNDGGIHELNGYMFEGKNGNLMFIPAAGYCADTDCYGVGTGGHLWSKTLTSTPLGAYGLGLNSLRTSTYINTRYYGFSVRPVINL